MNYIKCNLCNQDNTRLLFKSWDRQHRIDRKKFNIVKCQYCGLVYLNPQPSNEELKRYYPENYAPYNQTEVFKYGPVSRLLKKFAVSFWRPGKQRAVGPIESLSLQQKIRSYRPDKSGLQDDRTVHYLDYGCGGGAHLEDVRLKHPDWQLFGLDNSAQACAVTQARGFQVYCGEIDKVNLPTGYFDIVNMSHVIEHLSDPKQALKKVHNILKPNGQVIISTPNFSSLAARVFRSFWFALETPRHLFLFTPKTLRQTLAQSGFKVKNIKYKTTPAVEIKSIYYFLGKRDLRISPIIWRLYLPFTKLLARFNNSSIMAIEAQRFKPY